MNRWIIFAVFLSMSVVQLAVMAKKPKPKKPEARKPDSGFVLVENKLPDYFADATIELLGYSKTSRRPAAMEVKSGEAAEIPARQYYSIVWTVTAREDDKKTVLSLYSKGPVVIESGKTLNLTLSKPEEMEIIARQRDRTLAVGRIIKMASGITLTEVSVGSGTGRAGSVSPPLITITSVDGSKQFDQKRMRFG